MKLGGAVELGFGRTWTKDLRERVGGTCRDFLIPKVLWHFSSNLKH